MKTIFKRPLFVNPQAYTIIPELYSVDKLLQFDFDENDTYTTKLVYNGRVESIIKKAGEEHILHLDLYTVDGSCVLGEWYVKGIDSESVVTIDKNILTIVANNNLKYPCLIAAWSVKGKTNEDADRNVLKDLTGNGHDITLNNFAWNTESGYSNPKYPDALVFDGVDDYGIAVNLPRFDDFTFICLRDYLTKDTSKFQMFGLLQKQNGNNNIDRIFDFESCASNDSFYFLSYGNQIKISSIMNFNKSVTWANTNSYNGLLPIDRGDNQIYDTNDFYLGKSQDNLRFFHGIFYSAYLFDRSLDEQEIKSFIRKHIDPEYLLPSEQYLVLNQGKLNINKLK